MNVGGNLELESAPVIRGEGCVQASTPLPFWQLEPRRESHFRSGSSVFREQPASEHTGGSFSRESEGDSFSFALRPGVHDHRNFGGVDPEQRGLQRQSEPDMPEHHRFPFKELHGDGLFPRRQ